jgi:hypothetical protein
LKKYGLALYSRFTPNTVLYGVAYVPEETHSAEVVTLGTTLTRVGDVRGSYASYSVGHPIIDPLSTGENTTHETYIQGHMETDGS